MKRKRTGYSKGFRLLQRDLARSTKYRELVSRQLEVAEQVERNIADALMAQAVADAETTGCPPPPGSLVKVTKQDSGALAVVQRYYWCRMFGFRVVGAYTDGKSRPDFRRDGGLLFDPKEVQLVQRDWLSTLRKERVK